ncbi:Uncharacterised protein [Salmonella enterica subsp. enterica serovar Daytona]|uniref:Uncharacterized protein n=1 Tax=Salmonella enterica subsp. enterica serovar Daytona TaxID=1962639 RepID=A0A447JCN6_SALET|nr:Uncharacterised protein [Salmonella enterica subsp. enterica serovar Daytona]
MLNQLCVLYTLIAGVLFNNVLFFLVFKEFAFVEVVWMVYQFVAAFYNQNHIFVSRKIYL